MLKFRLSNSSNVSDIALVILSDNSCKTCEQLMRITQILANKERNMRNIGLDRMDVRAVFRRTLASRLDDLSFIDCIADAVGNVLEENNSKLWEMFQEAIKKGDDYRQLKNEPK